MDQLEAVKRALGDDLVSQNALARESKISQTTISAIVLGRSENPGVKTVAALYSALLRLRPELAPAATEGANA